MKKYLYKGGGGTKKNDFKNNHPPKKEKESEREKKPSFIGKEKELFIIIFSIFFLYIFPTFFFYLFKGKSIRFQVFKRNYLGGFKWNIQGESNFPIPLFSVHCPWTTVGYLDTG